MFGKLFIAVIGAAGLVNGVVVRLFSDRNCNTFVEQRNVYANSCATGVHGFQSYRISQAGQGGQKVTTYNRDACAGAYTSCQGVGDLGPCFSAWNVNGGSNAISSSTICGTA